MRRSQFEIKYFEYNTSVTDRYKQNCKEKYSTYKLKRKKKSSLYLLTLPVA